MQTFTACGKIKRSSFNLRPTEDELVFQQNVDLKALFNDDYLKCTSCGADLKESCRRNKTVPKHPLLGVPYCEECCKFYTSGEFSADEDGEEKYCRWCGQGGTIFVCSSCTCGFCPTCIKKNIGRVALKSIEDSDEWDCFICDTTPLWKLRQFVELASRDIALFHGTFDGERYEGEIKFSLLFRKTYKSIFNNSARNEPTTSFAESRPSSSSVKRRILESSSDESEIEIDNGKTSLKRVLTHSDTRPVARKRTSNHRNEKTQNTTELQNESLAFGVDNAKVESIKAMPKKIVNRTNGNVTKRGFKIPKKQIPSLQASGDGGGGKIKKESENKMTPASVQPEPQDIGIPDEPERYFGGNKKQLERTKSPRNDDRIFKKQKTHAPRNEERIMKKHQTLDSTSNVNKSKSPRGDEELPVKKSRPDSKDRFKSQRNYETPLRKLWQEHEKGSNSDGKERNRADSRRRSLSPIGIDCNVTEQDDVSSIGQGSDWGDESTDIDSEKEEQKRKNQTVKTLENMTTLIKLSSDVAAGTLEKYTEKRKGPKFEYRKLEGRVNDVIKLMEGAVQTLRSLFEDEVNPLYEEKTDE